MKAKTSTVILIPLLLIGCTTDEGTFAQRTMKDLQTKHSKKHTDNAVLEVYHYCNQPMKCFGLEHHIDGSKHVLSNPDEEMSYGNTYRRTGTAVVSGTNYLICSPVSDGAITRTKFRLKRHGQAVPVKCPK